MAVPGAIAFDFGVPGFRLSPWVLAASVILSGLLLVVTIRAVWRARGRPVVTGAQGMIGARGRVLSWAAGAGVVLVHRERWAAATSAPLAPGQAGKVLARRGLRLEVAPGPAQDGGKSS